MLPRKRKLGPRQLERAQKIFNDAVCSVAKELGAVQGEVWSNDVPEFTLETKVGQLYLRPIAALSEAGGFVALRFKDVDSACARLNPSRHLSELLNPFSGKWNLDLYGYISSEEIRQELLSHLRRVL